jgi:tRNA modification GTPase
LLDQVQGSLVRELRDLLSSIRCSNRLEALSGCERLLQRARLGLQLLKPWRLTFAGPPNAGKSSLINALVGASRVLVHHEPGTTRDAVDTEIVVAAWPVIITDTAGVRDAQGSIEQMGIATARRRWDAADVGLLVVDASVGWTDVHEELIERRRRPTLIVLNKQDLQPAATIPAHALLRISGLSSAEGTVAVVPTRATQAGGTDALLAALGAHFDAWLPPSGSGVPFLPEHVALLERVKECCVQERFDEAAWRLSAALEPDR